MIVNFCFCFFFSHKVIAGYPYLLPSEVHVMQNISTQRPENCWRCLRIYSSRNEKQCRTLMPSPRRGNKLMCSRRSYSEMASVQLGFLLLPVRFPYALSLRPHLALLHGQCCYKRRTVCCSPTLAHIVADGRCVGRTDKPNLAASAGMGAVGICRASS